MAFSAQSAEAQKLEFVRLARAEGMAFAELCRRFGVSRTCGCKWLGRYGAGGEPALAERSRRPLASPSRTPVAVEAAAVAVRTEHPAWGGRKIAKVLLREEGMTIAPSTVTGVLRRNGVPLGGEWARGPAPIRFEAEAPNLLWQMDFKGHVAMAQNGARLHPLTVVDDHSRFALAIAACDNEREATVQAHLVATFRRYGLPRRMLTDNGSPWGTAAQGRFSALTVWLIEHGVAVGHARPLHPQTMGKDERFHRSLNAEVLRGTAFADLARAQAGLDRWRDIYNGRRPHEALGGAVPLDRYTPSPRAWSDAVEPFDYLEGDLLRRVQPNGRVSLGGRWRRVGRAFAGRVVALRPGELDGRYAVFFRHQHVADIDLATEET
jgi:transposase InsO family protein